MDHLCKKNKGGKKSLLCGSRQALNAGKTASCALGAGTNPQQDLPLRASSQSNLGNRSKKFARRGQILPTVRSNGSSIVQKGDETWAD